MKKCTKCQVVKVPEAFRKDTRYTSGLCSHCKTCVNKCSKIHREKIKAWKEANGIPTTVGIEIPWRGQVVKVAAYKVKLTNEGVYTKRCKVCEKWFPVDNFSRQRATIVSDCKPCELAYQKQWREDNRERLREQYYERKAK